MCAVFGVFILSVLWYRQNRPLTNRKKLIGTNWDVNGLNSDGNFTELHVCISVKTIVFLQLRSMKFHMFESQPKFFVFNQLLQLGNCQLRPCSG